MATLSLRISVPAGKQAACTKTMQFEPSTMVYDAIAEIRQKLPEAAPVKPHKRKRFYKKKFMLNKKNEWPSLNMFGHVET